jgi:aryl-alcohol dehydrogenase-like predicted oxidoreductase
VTAVATELGATVSQVALAWVLAKPQVSSVIFGARTIAQLDDNLAAAELVIPPPLLAKLDEVSATPLGYPYKFMYDVQKGW